MSQIMNFMNFVSKRVRLIDHDDVFILRLSDLLFLSHSPGLIFEDLNDMVPWNRTRQCSPATKDTRRTG